MCNAEEAKEVESDVHDRMLVTITTKAKEFSAGNSCSKEKIFDIYIYRVVHMIVFGTFWAKFSKYFC